MAEAEPEKRSETRAPRVVWRVLFGLTLAGLVQLAWNVADPLTVVMVDDGGAGDLDDLDLAEHSLPPDDLYVEDPYAEDPYAEDPYAEDLDAPREAEVDSTAPITAGGTDAVETPVDPSERLAALRELIRGHGEPEDGFPEEPADEPELVDPSVDSLLEGIEFLDETYEQDPGAGLEPTWETTEPWGYALRMHVWTVLMLLLAGLLLFVGRRNGESHYAFAGSLVGIQAATDGLLSLFPMEYLYDARWPQALQASTMHLTLVAFLVLAFTARRRAGLLAILVIGAELASWAMWEIRIHDQAWAWVTFTPFVFKAVPWLIVASVFAQRGWPSSASAAQIPGAGPYRSGPPASASESGGTSARLVVRFFGAWFALQLLSLLLPAMRLAEPLTCAGYVVAADLALAVLVTIEARKARDANERRLWLSTAALLWALTLVNATGQAALAMSWGATVLDVRGLGTAPTLFLRALSASCAGGAIGLIIKSLQASAEARRTDDDEPAIVPRNAEVYAAVLGAAALRWFIASPTHAGVTPFWLVLAVLLVIGAVCFIRVTRPFREHVPGASMIARRGRKFATRSREVDDEE